MLPGGVSGIPGLPLQDILDDSALARTRKFISGGKGKCDGGLYGGGGIAGGGGVRGGVDLSGIRMVRLGEESALWRLNCGESGLLPSWLTKLRLGSKTGSFLTSSGVRGDSSEAGEHVTGDGGNTSRGGLWGRRLGKGAGMSHGPPSFFVLSQLCWRPINMFGSKRATGLLISSVCGSFGALLTNVVGSHVSGFPGGPDPPSSDGKYFISS